MNKTPLNMLIGLFALILTSNVQADTYRYTGLPFTHFSECIDEPLPNYLEIIINTKTGSPTSGDITLSEREAFEVTDGIRSVNNLTYDPAISQISLSLQSGKIVGWTIYVF